MWRVRTARSVKLPPSPSEADTTRSSGERRLPAVGVKRPPPQGSQTPLDHWKDSTSYMYSAAHLCENKGYSIDIAQVWGIPLDSVK